MEDARPALEEILSYPDECGMKWPVFIPHNPEYLRKKSNCMHPNIEKILKSKGFRTSQLDDFQHNIKYDVLEIVFDNLTIFQLAFNGNSVIQLYTNNRSKYRKNNN